MRAVMLRVILATVGAATLWLASGCDVDWQPTQRPPLEEADLRELGHTIGGREVKGRHEFYDTRSGRRFVPRGPNLHRMAVEHGTVVDTLFGVGTYDPGWVDEQLAAIAALGYNSVRTSLDLCRDNCLGSPSGGLNQVFLDNVADFLQRAYRHNLQVFLTSNDLPLAGGYVPRVEATGGDQFDGYLNSHYFHRVGFEVYRDYWVSIVQGLVDRRAALEAVAGYELRGELWMFEDRPPLSLRSGKVTTANGNIYNLADPRERSYLRSENIEFWLDSIRSAIREVDPTALVGVGVFAPNEPNPWRDDSGNRGVPMSPIWASSLDFIDVHTYPGYISFAELAENLLMRPGDQSKPVILGEFGAFRFAFGSPVTGAAGLMPWQAASCAYGIDGWFHWHWQGVDDHEVWTGTDGGGAINTVLAPAERPDACVERAFGFLENNLARDRPVRTSRAAEAGSRAVDGLASTAWRSGAGAPGWLEVSLAAPSTVRQVRLTVDQWPSGATVHEVRFRVGDRWQLVHTFDGVTNINEVLHVPLPTPVTGVTAVRIDTLASPSFVGWYEIEVIGT